MRPTADDKPATGFVDKSFVNADGTKSPYVVYVPPGYDGSKPVPLVLFLHGLGETKGGGKTPVEQGIGNKHLAKREKTFEAIVVFPRSEEAKIPYNVRWLPDNPDGKRAMAMLDQTAKDYKTDPKRVYLTGLSMGGFGTWGLAHATPDRWAAIVPICGGGKPEWAETIAKIPCWCFHGDKDEAVPVARSREMVAALKKAGGEPKYTELKGVGHNSWDAAYDTDDLYTWLLAQHK